MRNQPKQERICCEQHYVSFYTWHLADIRMCDVMLFTTELLLLWLLQHVQHDVVGGPSVNGLCAVNFPHQVAHSLRNPRCGSVTLLLTLPARSDFWQPS